MVISMNNTAPRTLSTTEAGVSRSIYTLRPGAYIWHAGAYRLVTAVDGRTVRMGRYVLHSLNATTVEAAPLRAVFAARRAA